MYKCKICGKKYTELSALYNHIENKHKEMIPQDMTVQQYYYYMKTGKMNGNCVMCKQPTSWNANTGKYNRFCGDPKCKDEYVKIMKGRMVAKYGKTHLLNDPNKQREMLANRSISGEYTWSDGKHKSTYTGSYELDFLKTLDGFFDWDPEDISMPSPHTYTYKYNGEDKFYIPDVFIHSLDLELEIKDGGDNPNNHHKIQDVDKEKERLKDEVLCSQKLFHYVKITNKNYENFFQFLKEVKKGFEKYGDEKKIPRIFKIEDIKGTNIKPLKENVEIIEEDLKDAYYKFEKFNKAHYKENDMFLSLRYDMVKNSPEELQDFLHKLIKGARYKDDLDYVRRIARKSDDYYKLRIKRRPETKDAYAEYYSWLKSGGMEGEIRGRLKKLKETFEAGSILSESSISMSQINMYLQNQYEEEMRNYLNTYKKYYNMMLREQPSAVKHINEDIRKCLIVIDGMADKGVENNLVQFAKDDLGEIVKAAKHGKPVKVFESMVDDLVNIDDSTNDINLISVQGDNVSISNEVINFKLVYESSNNRPFSLNDTTSKLIIDDRYVIQRDRIGTHCNITPIYKGIDQSNVLEFQIVLNESFDLYELENKLDKGISIASLYSPDNNIFLREASLRLFGKYPKEIKTKNENNGNKVEETADKIYNIYAKAKAKHDDVVCNIDEFLVEPKEFFIQIWVDKRNRIFAKSFKVSEYPNLDKILNNKIRRYKK